jgi:hypothetical protein
VVESPPNHRIGREIALGKVRIHANEWYFEMALHISRLVRIVAAGWCGVAGPDSQITAGYAKVQIGTGIANVELRKISADLGSSVVLVVALRAFLRSRLYAPVYAVKPSRTVD